MRLIFIVGFLFISLIATGQKDPLKVAENVSGLSFNELPLKGHKISISPDTIYSLSTDSEVTGLSYNHEFCQYLIPRKLKKEPSKKYVTDAISRGEFNEFMQWAIDSNARMMIFYGVRDGSGAVEWVNYEDSYRNGHPEVEVINWNDRGINGSYFHLDWSKKLDYYHPELVPILNDIYIPQNSRFRKRKMLDYRRVCYEFEDSISRRFGQVPLFVDGYNWMDSTDHNFGRMAVLAYLNQSVLPEEAISFIEPFMAEAYCHWMTKQINKELSSEKWSVQCRLPTASEIISNPISNKGSIKLGAYDHTDDWQITNSEYHGFSEYLLDSICREYLYQMEDDHKLALKLLKTDASYFYSEQYREYLDLDPSDRDFNREFFPWKSDKRVRWKKYGVDGPKEIIESLELKTLPCRYEWIDHKAKARKGELYPYRVEEGEIQQHALGTLLLKNEYSEDGTPTGENLVLKGHVNEIGESLRINDPCAFSVRDFKNLSLFNKTNVVMIPLPRNIPKNEEIADITYEQALAYYNWKFRIDKFEEGDDWQQYVFPTVEEFNRIKKGESIIHPAQEIEYDSPVFRMVVEVIEK
ncbi:MAG: hypothetical protein NXI10_09860 [bacterium]|nr:hypothetical protein [bacterium]